jgi:hypothetical protein
MDNRLDSREAGQILTSLTFDNSSLIHFSKGTSWASDRVEVALRSAPSFFLFAMFVAPLHKKINFYCLKNVLLPNKKSAKKKETETRMSFV